jgi:hypothetical protein
MTQQNPSRFDQSGQLNYAPPPRRPVSLTLWMCWFATLLLVLPLGVICVYNAMDPTAFNHQDERVRVGLLGAVCLLLGLPFIVYVPWVWRRGRHLLPEPTSATSAPSLTPMLMCLQCGAFPESAVVQTAAAAGRVWTMRGAGTVCIAGATGLVVLYFMERIDYQYHVLTTLLVLVGMGLWRDARDPTRHCPNCGATKLSNAPPSVTQS